MEVLPKLGSTSFLKIRLICERVLCRPSLSSSLRCSIHCRYTALKLCSSARRTAWRLCLRSTLGLMPLASRSEEHTSELQSLMRISYAVFCLKKKKKKSQSRLTELQYNQQRFYIHRQ